MNPFQWLLDRIAEAINTIGSPLKPLVDLIHTTPLQLTTANPVVLGLWQTMTGVADAFLILFVIITTIQMMYGQSTGTLYMPLSQFIPRILLVAIMMHVSLILGQDLILINNELCGLLSSQTLDMGRFLNSGQLLNNGQAGILGIVIAVVAGFSLFRYFLQRIKSIVMFNLLFVLSAPAFLTTIHPSTSDWFSLWAKSYVSTAFSQFFQFLAFALGYQFLLTTKFTGLTGTIIAIAILNFVAEIPGLLSRFAASPPNSRGLAGFASAALALGRLLL